MIIKSFFQFNEGFNIFKKSTISKLKSALKDSIEEDGKFIHGGSCVGAEFIIHNNTIQIRLHGDITKVAPNIQYVESTNTWIEDHSSPENITHTAVLFYIVVENDINISVRDPDNIVRNFTNMEDAVKYVVMKINSFKIIWDDEEKQKREFTKKFPNGETTYL